ncbi:hypothetical protein ACPA0F_07945 [Solibacillus silvestris]
MTLYNFKRLIQRYSTAFTVQSSTDCFYDDDTGEYVPGTTENKVLQGAIIPANSILMSDKSSYQSGGRLTESDRLLFSLVPLELKTKIQHKGKTYHVEEEDDYSDFADFYHYTLKAVSAFNATTE